MADYSEDLLKSICELGRLYLEMGFFVPAERIFNGLIVIEPGLSCARLGLAIVKLERGLYAEASSQFRLAMQSEQFQIYSKLGLCCCYLAQKDLKRASSILQETRGDITSKAQGEVELMRLYNALRARVEE